MDFQCPMDLRIGRGEAGSVSPLLCNFSLEMAAVAGWGRGCAENGGEVALGSIILHSPARESCSLPGAGPGRKEAWPNNELQEAAAAKSEALSQQTKGLKPELPRCCCPGLGWGRLLMGDVPPAPRIDGKGPAHHPEEPDPTLSHRASGACCVLEAGVLALRQMGRKWRFNTARAEQVGAEIGFFLALMSVFSSCPGFLSM